MQGGGRFGGERQQVQRAIGHGRQRAGNSGRFFQNHMGIGAANAERIDTGAARQTLGFPVAQRRIHKKRAVGKVDLRVGLLEMQAGRQLVVMQTEDGFNEADDARGDVEMADVGFDGAKGAKLRATSAAAKRLGQCSNFDGVAQFRACAVRFDVGNAVWVNACHGQALTDHGGLSIGTGREVARLLAAVVADGGTLDHGVNLVAIGDRLLQPLQHHHTRATAKNRAPRLGIEGATVAVWR